MESGTPANGTSAVGSLMFTVGTPDNPISWSIDTEEHSLGIKLLTGTPDSVERGVGDGSGVLRSVSGELIDLWAAILAVEGALFGRCVTHFFFFGLGFVSSSRPSFNAK